VTEAYGRTLHALKLAPVVRARLQKFEPPASVVEAR
jgi:hypothetical protein